MAALDTFQSIVGDVHAHALGVDSLLVEGWVRDTWAEIERLRTWSHLRRLWQVNIPAPYTTGTATFTPGSSTVTIATGVVSEAHVGRQLQRAMGEPIHDITAVDTGANTYTIYPAWQTTTTTVSAQAFRVFTAYLVVPQDFFAWVSVRDTDKRRRLNPYLTLDELDLWDPKRSLGTRPAALVGIDWTRTYAGRVYSTLRITQAGSSPTPVASGAYNGQSDAILVLRITGTGALDVATFSYALDAATPTSLVVSSSGNDLPMGVRINWPVGTYTNGAVFVVRLSTQAVLGVPRYELYPHPTEAMVLSTIYSTRPTDCEADGWTVPMPITGDVIKLGALDQMARYPGTREKPNPYAQIGRSTEWRQRFEDAITQLMTMDEYIIGQNITYAQEAWPFAMLPWAYNSQTDDYASLFV